MEQVKFVGMEENTLRFALSGDVDLGNADAFYEEVSRAYNAAPSNIVFDCADLNFIDSTTLGTFVKLFKEAQKNGHGVKLCNLQPKIKKLFVICSLDQIMEIA
jgi:anti-sigma B factor antagonist